MNQTPWFDVAWRMVRAHEGPCSVDPKDSGGMTVWGISRRWHPDWPGWTLVDLLLDSGRTLIEAAHDPEVRDQARTFYFEVFWRRTGLHRMSKHRVAVKVFDLAVNMGPRPAVMALQRALVRTGVSVQVDGVIGPETLGAVAAHPHIDWLLDALRVEAVRRYLEIGNRRYLAGWIRRAIA